MIPKKKNKKKTFQLGVTKTNFLKKYLVKVDIFINHNYQANRIAQT